MIENVWWSVYLERTKLVIIIVIIAVVFLVVSLTFPFDVLEKARGIQLKQLIGFYENILVQKNDRTIIMISQKV